MVENKDYVCVSLIIYMQAHFPIYTVNPCVSDTS